MHSCPFLSRLCFSVYGQGVDPNQSFPYRKFMPGDVIGLGYDSSTKFAFVTCNTQTIFRNKNSSTKMPMAAICCIASQDPKQAATMPQFNSSKPTILGVNCGHDQFTFQALPPCQAPVHPINMTSMPKDVKWSLAERRLVFEAGKTSKAVIGPLTKFKAITAHVSSVKPVVAWFCGVCVCFQLYSCVLSLFPSAVTVGAALCLLCLANCTVSQAPKYISALVRIPSCTEY